MYRCVWEGEKLSAYDPDEKIEPEELIDSLATLSKADKQRLRMLSRVYAGPARMMPEDLLQDAMAKVIEDKRHCPVGVPIVVFLHGIIKSLASNEVDKRERRKAALAIEETHEDYDLFSASSCCPDAVSPEKALIIKEREIAFHDFLMEQCGNDDKTMLVLLGAFDGLKGADLCQEAGVSKQELATINKRIWRMMAKFKKEGSTQ
jgi:DNA-directed RNA polymerase specialized sigma24 family protein